MKPNKVLLVTFSPTHTSSKIGKTIVAGFSIDNCETIDLTLALEAPQINVEKDTLVVFAFPVYGGNVAPLAMQRLSKLKANGSLAVTVVVYGNRAFDNALTQLDDFATERGCRVVASGAFVGEHSYSNSTYPIAEGRPNNADLSDAKSFGERIIEKIGNSESVEDIAIVKAKDIPLPTHMTDGMMAFFSEVKQTITSGIALPNGPTVDTSLCSNCGICAENCPTQAIKKGEEDKTNFDKCIKCCACIKLCPSNARSFNTPISSLLNKYFFHNKENVSMM